MFVERKQEMRPVAVWDLPVRLFHWLLVGLVVGAWASNSLGDMDSHALLGYSVLALVLFRLAWGIVGGTYARFASFLRGPRTTLAYARAFLARRADPVLGHNPLGGWMVVALLLALATQAGLGLFATDDILFDGPLNHLVSSGTASRLSSLHRQLFDGIVVLVALHLLGVVAHLVIERCNLVRPMITGIKHAPAHLADQAARGGHPLLALALLAVAAAAVWALVTLL